MFPAYGKPTRKRGTDKLAPPLRVEFPSRIALALLAICVTAAHGEIYTTQTAMLRGEVLDARSGKPLACRIYIGVPHGSWHFAKSDSPGGSAVEYRKKTGGSPPSVEMHTTLSAHPFIAELPSGEYTVLVERGKEYFPESRTVKIGQNDERIAIPLRRWTNMAELGWYSGDTHVHRTLAELPNLLMAEDLNVALPLTSWVTEAFVAPAKSNRRRHRDTPPKLIRVDDTHVIYPRNTEYEIFSVGKKSHTLGAFFVLGHKTLFEEGVPPVRPALQRARDEGALLDLDKHNWPWSMMLVPVLGIDLFELSNNHICESRVRLPRLRGSGAAVHASRARREGLEIVRLDRLWISQLLCASQLRVPFASHRWNSKRRSPGAVGIRQSVRASRRRLQL